MPVIVTFLTATILFQQLYFRRRLRLKEQELARQRELAKFGEKRLADSAEAWRFLAFEEKNADANQS